MPKARVRVATASLLRAWKQAEYTELWLQFEPVTNDDVTDEVVEAIIAANAAFPEDMGDSDFVFCEGPWLAPFGPPAYLATLSRTTFEAGVVKWLDRFADHLAGAGLTGRIIPAPTDDHASYAMVDNVPRTNLTTFLAYTVVDPAPSRQEPFTWNVDDDTTAKIAAHVERGHFPRADTYLSASRRLWRTAAAPAAAMLRRRLPADCIAGVTYLRPDPPRLTYRSFYVNGTSTYTVYDPQQSWRDLLAQALDTMTAVPEATDLAFVQYSIYLLGGWGGIRSELPPLPGTRSTTSSTTHTSSPSSCPMPEEPCFSPTPIWPVPTTSAPGRSRMSAMAATSFRPATWPPGSLSPSRIPKPSPGRGTTSGQ